MHIGNVDCLLSFNDRGKSYLFGKTPSIPFGLGAKVLDDAANWWIINDDPKTGFAPAVQKAKMSSGHRALTTFYLNNHPYIFGLHEAGANIWCFNDDPKTGFRLVKHGEKMSFHYHHVLSFQLKDEPYILGLHADGGANIWHIKDERAKGLTFNLLTKHKIKMSHNYQRLSVFYIGKDPYLFGLHENVGANIWRIKDDPSQELDLVMKGAKFPYDYDYVLPFHLGGRPYLLGVVSVNYAKEAGDLIKPDYKPGKSGEGALIESLVKVLLVGTVEWGKGYGAIWEIGCAPSSLSLKKISKDIPISHRYTQVTTFEQEGKAYMFGIHEDGFANIWRVNDDPAAGFTLEYYGRNK